MKPIKRRTIQQNRALHKWLGLLADEFNERELDMRLILKPHIPIPATTQLLKDTLWRPVQKMMTGKTSTKDLTTREIDLIYDVMNRHLIEAHKIHIPFPSLEELSKSPKFLKIK